MHTHTQRNYDYVCLLNATNNAHCVSRTQMCICVRAPERVHLSLVRSTTFPIAFELWKNCNKHVKMVYHLKAHTHNFVIPFGNIENNGVFFRCCCCLFMIMCARVRFFLFQLFLSIIKTWCWRYDLRLNRISTLLINAFVLCASKHHAVCIRIHSYRQIQHDSTTSKLNEYFIVWTVSKALDCFIFFS